MAAVPRGRAAFAAPHAALRLHPRIRCLRILGLVGAALVAAAAAAAQSPPSGVSVSARILGTPWARTDRWNAAIFHLQNQGAAPVRTVLEVREPGTPTAAAYRKAITLPPGARWKVPVGFRAHPRGDSPFRLEATFPDHPGTEFVTEVLAYRAPSIIVVGWLAPPPVLPAEDDDFDLVGIPATELPAESVLLGTFDRIYWADPDGGPVTADERQGLAGWVLEGGHLVLETLEPARLDVAIPGLSAAVHSASVRATRLTTQGPCGGQGADANATPFGALVWTVPGGEARAWTEHGPVVVTLRQGRGWITLVGVRLPTETLRAPAAREAFRRALGLSVRPVLQPLDQWRDRTRWEFFWPDGLTQFFVANYLPASGLAVMVLLFVIGTGPIEYWVLRKRGRLTWTWVTYPAATLAFWGFVWLATGRGGLGQARLREVRIVDGSPDGVARIVHHDLALFLPQGGPVRASLDGPGTMDVELTWTSHWLRDAPEALTVNVGDAGTEIRTRSSPGDALVLRARLPASGALMTLRVRAEGEGVWARIRNLSRRRAGTGHLYWRGRRYAVPEVLPGGEFAGTLELAPPALALAYEQRWEVAYRGCSTSERLDLMHRLGAFDARGLRLWSRAIDTEGADDATYVAPLEPEPGPLRVEGVAPEVEERLEWARVRTKVEGT